MIPCSNWLFSTTKPWNCTHDWLLYSFSAPGGSVTCSFSPSGSQNCRSDRTSVQTDSEQIPKRSFKLCSNYRWENCWNTNPFQTDPVFHRPFRSRGLSRFWVDALGESARPGGKSRGRFTSKGTNLQAFRLRRITEMPMRPTRLWNHENSAAICCFFPVDLGHHSHLTWNVAFKSKALSHRGAMESLNLFWVSPCPKHNDSCLDHRSSFTHSQTWHCTSLGVIILEPSEVSWNCCQTGMIDEPLLKHYSHWSAVKG